MDARHRYSTEFQCSLYLKIDHRVLETLAYIAFEFHHGLSLHADSAILGKATITTSVIAVLIAMAIAGLWHGPAWTYVIFGTLHGCALAINQVWRRRKMKLPAWLGWLLTFVFVDISFVFFRSSNVPSALHMLNSMLPHADLFGTAALAGVIPMNVHLLLKPVAVGVVLAFFFKTSQQQCREIPPHSPHGNGDSGTSAGLLVVYEFHSGQGVCLLCLLITLP